MNQAGIQALKRALGNAGDDLYRAQMQRRADSTWVSGNGESIGTVIDDYQRRYDELTEAVYQAEAS